MSFAAEELELAAVDGDDGGVVTAGMEGVAIGEGLAGIGVV